MNLQAHIWCVQIWILESVQQIITQISDVWKCDWTTINNFHKLQQNKNYKSEPDA